MLLIWNATNDWTKSSLFFYPYYIGESAKLFSKNSDMQYARETWCNPVCTAYACYNTRVSYSIHCSKHVRISDRDFLQTTLLISTLVQVKIKILFSCWWRLELATSAYCKLVWPRKHGIRVVILDWKGIRVSKTSIFKKEYFLSPCFVKQ